MNLEDMIVEAVINHSDFAEGVESVLNDSDFLDSAAFTDAVHACVDRKIENKVERAIENSDIPQLIKDEMPSYDDEIETLTGRIENQNEMIGKLLEKTIEQSEMIEALKLRCERFDVPPAQKGIITKFIDWLVGGLISID